MSMGNLWRMQKRLPSMNVVCEIRNADKEPLWQTGQPTMFYQSLYKYAERLQHHMDLKESHD